MKKILFPTDFSNVANNAFLHALSLARIIQGELLLLHTYEYPIVDSQFAPMNYKEIFDSLELSNFDRFKEELPNLHKIATENGYEDIEMNYLLLDGDLLFNIKQTIKKENIDFVVMGTAGAAGWKELFFGTNTGEAIANLSVPVLSVPETTKYTKIETIGFTTRFREKDKEALKKVIEIAKAAKAMVKCLYVETEETDNSEEVFEAWRNAFKKEPVQFFIIKNDDINQTIEDFIRDEKIDVLTLLTYKRGFFEWLFTTSFTEKMSYHSTIPIIAFHE